MWGGMPSPARPETQVRRKSWRHQSKHANRIELALEAAKLSKWFPGWASKDKGTVSPDLLKQRKRLRREMNDVRLAVFSPPPGHRRNRLREVEFIPSSWAASSRRWPVSARNSTKTPYDASIVRAPRMTQPSSSSVSTRSRATSLVGDGTPSAGELSSTALPMHQLKKVLIYFRAYRPRPAHPLHNRHDQVDDVMLTDLVDTLASEGLTNLTSQKSLDFPA